MSEGEIPHHLRQSLYVWTRRQFLLPGDVMAGQGSSVPDRGLIELLERRMAMSPALNWRDEGVALEDLMERFEADDGFATALIEQLLTVRPSEYIARELAEIFEAPESRWTVSGLDAMHPHEFHLVLRGTGPIPEVVAYVARHSVAAHDHLTTAWTKVTQQTPEPSVAVSEAVKAVEAAAKPAVIPDDPKATLGKIAEALEAKPEKWRVVLRGERVEDVQRRLEILRRSQEQHRHGDSEPREPLTLAQARAAVALAIELVSYFIDGSIGRVDGV